MPWFNLCHSKSQLKKGGSMRFLKGLIIGSAALVMGVAGPSLASPQHPGSSSQSPLQKGLAFYRGKTVDFIVPTSAGAEFDSAARIMTAAMAGYLHVTFEIEDISAGLAITGQDTLAHSVPNGLTIGMLETGLDVNNLIENEPALNFNPAREQMLGGPTNSTTVVIVAPTTPYRSFSGLISDSTEDPPNLLLQTVSATNTSVKLFLESFGIKANVIYGYANSNAIIAGFLRGDGDLVYQSVNAVLPLVQGGKARAVGQQVLQPVGSPAYEALLGVPTFAQLGKKYPPSTKREKRAWSLFNAVQAVSSIAVAAPAATPNPEVVAMRAAIKRALTGASVTSQFETVGDPIGYVSYAAEKDGYVRALGLVDAIRALTGS